MRMHVAWARMLGAQALKAHQRWHKKARAMERVLIMDQRKAEIRKRVGKKSSQVKSKARGKAESKAMGKRK